MALRVVLVVVMSVMASVTWCGISLAGVVPNTEADVLGLAQC